MASDAASLADRHEVFAELLSRNGRPPLWRREPSFGTLVRLILEQQVSLASANAAFTRLEERIGEVAPSKILELTDDQMRADGFSRQKTSYVRGIARLIEADGLDLVDIASDTEGGFERLVAVRGIGPWTASCFALFVSGDRDVWPTGDRALYVSMSRNLDLPAVPDAEQADRIAADWTPFRSTAARMLWHDYLGGRSYVPREGAGFVEGSGKVPM